MVLTAGRGGSAVELVDVVFEEVAVEDVAQSKEEVGVDA